MVEGRWDGMKIPITSVSVRGGRSLALHTYPDVPGQEVEDQGRNAATFGIEATYGPELADVWGKNIYPEGLRLLVKRLETKGSGIFVHPIWGERNCAAMDWSYDDAASSPDQTVIRFTLVEDSLEPFSLEDSTTLSREGDITVRAERLDRLIMVNEGDGWGTPFADLIASFRMSLYMWNSMQYWAEHRLMKLRADIRDLKDMFPRTFGDCVNVGMLEDIVHLQKDMRDMVAGIEKDAPMFVAETVSGDTTLFDLAVKYYSDRSRWEDLQSLNAARVSNPASVPSGTLIYRQAV